MRILRSSLYSEPDKPPLIAIVRDCDMRDTLEGIRASATALGNANGSLVLCEIFRVAPGTSVEEATLLAGQRARFHAEQEHHQATMYHWLAGLWEHGVNGRLPAPGAEMFGDVNCPLSAQEMRVVLEQLAQHPLYDNFVLSYPDRDGNMIVLRDGEVQ